MTNIAVTNRKGGVGKTTMTLTLGAALATLGYKVCIVDTDSQGHIAHSLNVERRDALFDILVDNKGFIDGETIFEVDPDVYTSESYPGKGQLFVLPGADKTYRIARELEDHNVFAVMETLDSLKEQRGIHFVIVDTSPTLKDLDAQVSLAIDAYLYVTEAEDLSIDGLNRAVRQMRSTASIRERHMNRRTAILGILPNKVRNTDLHAFGIETMEEHYQHLVMSPVKLRTVWGEASAVREVIFRYAPGSNAADEAWNMTEEMIEALKKWQIATS